HHVGPELVRQADTGDAVLSPVLRAGAVRDQQWPQRVLLVHGERLWSRHVHLRQVSQTTAAPLSASGRRTTRWLALLVVALGRRCRLRRRVCRRGLAGPGAERFAFVGDG